MYMYEFNYSLYKMPNYDKKCFFFEKEKAGRSVENQSSKAIKIKSIADGHLYSGATERFEKETLRSLNVLEAHLSGKFSGESRDYLAGKGRGKYSIADIGTWPWVKEIATSSIKGKLDETPHLAKYIERIAQRPACQRGVGKDYSP